MKRVQEVADYLGCSGSNVRRLLRQGRIKGTRTPKGWMMRECKIVCVKGLYKSTSVLAY